MILSFQEYVAAGKVKKANVDVAEAKSLMKYSLEDFEVIRKGRITENNASIKLKEIYDCLRCSLQAFMALEGYNPYSHEAIIAFAKELGLIGMAQANDIDRFRMLRNDISYRAQRATPAEAKEILQMAAGLLPKLSKLFTAKTAGK